MATVAISIRAEEALAARVDAFAASVMAERPGLKVSRTEAILMLLTEALDGKGIKAAAAVPRSSASKKAPPPARAAAPKKGAKRTARKP